MKELILKRDIEKIDDFIEDYQKPTVEAIIKVCAEKGYSISPAIAMNVWEEYSEDLCAGWLGASGASGDSESMFKIVQEYTDVLKKTYSARIKEIDIDIFLLASFNIENDTTIGLQIVQYDRVIFNGLQDVQTGFRNIEFTTELNFEQWQDIIRNNEISFPFWETLQECSLLENKLATAPLLHSNLYK